MPRFYSLPPFLETLEEFDLDPKRVFEALAQYRDLATELLMEQPAQVDPFSFLNLSDKRRVVDAFYQLFYEQSPQLLFDDDEEEADDF